MKNKKQDKLLLSVFALFILFFIVMAIFRLNTINKMGVLLNQINTNSFAESIETKEIINQFYRLLSDSFKNLIIATFFYVLISIGIALFTRKKLFKYEKILYEEKEELKVTFNSIGDGIITTDTNGNVLKLNKVAEEFTGWSAEDANGQSFEKVFDIINLLTGERAKNPVEYVLKTDKPCELENHTILTSKDGTQRHIADSAAPIKDYNDKTTGVVMIFRDVTERKIAENELKESEEKHRLLMTQMHQGLALHEIIFDDKGKGVDYRFIDVNESFEKMTGLKKEDIIGKTVLEALPDTESYWIEKYSHIATTGEPLQYENYSKEIGKYFEVNAYSPKYGQFVTIFTDITKRKQDEEILKQSKLLLNCSIESAKNMTILLIDNNYNYIHFNQTHKKQMKNLYDIDIEIGMNLIDCIKGEKDKIHSRSNFAHALNGESYNCIEKFGFYIRRYFEIFYNPIIDDDNKILGATCFSTDITKRIEKEMEIVYINNHDSLTGLYNRRFFEKEKDNIDNEYSLPLSVIMGDINGLKLINDSIGHSEGDQLLVAIANILKECCRVDHIIARTGGDEFVILMPKTSNKEAIEIIKNINLSCEEYNKNAISELYYTSISLGCDTKERIDESIEYVLKRAEDNMYRRKLLQSKSLHSNILSSMKRTMIEKSHETEDHAERLVHLSIKLGKVIGFTYEQIDDLKLLATLHDIGKIGISDQVLNKPGELTKQEWIEMKKHPEIGYRIAMSSPELVPIADCILYHHERWDGSGYPQGLSGEEIPLISRAVAVVDAYDAMTQDRTYRKAMTKEDAIIEIVNNAGTQFDPYIAKVFVEMLQNDTE